VCINIIFISFVLVWQYLAGANSYYKQLKPRVLFRRKYFTAKLIYLLAFELIYIIEAIVLPGVKKKVYKE